MLYPVHYLHYPLYHSIVHLQFPGDTSIRCLRLLYVSYGSPSEPGLKVNATRGGTNIHRLQIPLRVVFLPDLQVFG